MRSSEQIVPSKFEMGASGLGQMQKLFGDAQIVFILLLSLARHRQDLTDPEVVRAAEVEINNAVAAALLDISKRITEGSNMELPNLENMMNAFERSVAAWPYASGETAASAHLTKFLALYRALAVAVKQLSSEI